MSHMLRELARSRSLKYLKLSKDTLERVEGPRYVAQGYAYVLWRATGPLEEVADQVFQRWRDDASVVLDWLGEQPWCHSAPSNGTLSAGDTAGDTHEISSGYGSAIPFPSIKPR